MSGLLTPEEFGRDDVRGFLRSHIPHLFDEVELPKKDETFYNRASLAGALAVQKIAAGKIAPVSFGTDSLQVNRERLTRRHVINLVDGEPFDVFGFTPSRIAYDITDSKPIKIPETLPNLVEKQIAPLVSQLLEDILSEDEPIAS